MLKGPNYSRVSRLLMSKNLSMSVAELMHTKNQNIFKFMKKMNWMKGLRIVFTSSAILSKTAAFV